MKTISKALIGTVAAGAMAMTSASPAFARDRDDGINAGEIIAGALILGGIAAVASSAGNNRGYDDYRYNDRYNDRNYRGSYRQGNPRAAVEQCVRTAQQEARRAGYRNAQVTQIRDVDNTRQGWRVKGTVEVQGQRGYNRYDNRYDRRGYRSANYDSGRFTCDVSRGRVVDLDFSGVRGLR